jgi:hypothetical protein
MNPIPVVPALEQEETTTRSLYRSKYPPRRRILSATGSSSSVFQLTSCGMFPQIASHRITD